MQSEIEFRYGQGITFQKTQAQRTKISTASMAIRFGSKDYILPQYGNKDLPSANLIISNYRGNFINYIKMCVLLFQPISFVYIIL